jgi:hypothetical protein
VLKGKLDSESMKRIGLLLLVVFVVGLASSARNKPKSQVVPENVMQKIYDEVKTPYKYGLVMVPPDDSKKMDARPFSGKTTNGT